MARTNRRRGAGEGTVYRRSDGRWCAQVDLGYVDGRRRRLTVYGSTQAEAQRRLLEARVEVAAGRVPTVDARLTVAEFLQWWSTAIVPREVRPTTAYGYALNVRCHIVPAVGEVTLRGLTPAHVHGLLAGMVDRGYAPSTVRYVHATLRRALVDGIRFGYVKQNVAQAVRAPALERLEVQPLTVDEAGALLEAVRGDRLEALYRVALALGLRQGEALALRWQQVDLDAGTLHVAYTVRRVGGRVLEGAPKSARSRRTLTLPASCVDALLEHRRRQRLERLAAGPKWRGPLVHAERGPLVFPSRVGTHLEARNLLRHYAAALERAGLERRPWHDLRHSAASLLLAGGVHMRVVQEILGHANYAFTANVYAHVGPALHEAAAEAVDALLPAHKNARP